MVITRWDPFRDLAALQNRMNTMFQEISRTQGESDPLTVGSFAPPVNVYEDAQKLTLKIEVPGVKPEDLDIRVENNNLTVRGERKFDKEEKEENFHRVEHRYGSFYRAMTLPNTVNSDNVKADYENGVLRLSFEKKPEAKPKQIQINVTQGKQIEAGKPTPVETAKSA